MPDEPRISRRRALLGAGGLVGVGAVAYTGAFLAKRVRATEVARYGPEGATPQRALRIDAQPGFAADVPTRGMPDGPLYTPMTPEKPRRLSELGTPGRPILFHGRVVGVDGRPLTGAMVEVWHADGEGHYDEEGYNGRGHQFTDGEGIFAFETVKPFGYGERSLSLAGLVDYRAAHFHVKLRHGERTLTSQVWFPDDPRNGGDLGYLAQSGELVVRQQELDGELFARFDFVL